ncbi:preprotein translocase subunit SecF [Roseivivax halodurans JCM 10272]|uniref:Protein-export membrane protein SecF n=1 Tax=Roseivivax halodurans JCM 10272 TaxID=1449350 RepID=X7EHH4_9RHOB|nr:protein translocase subunit SecF [Roseivivax halodurans]ETX15534.1 preprotein translocase subunit SecF [Roseivivax halodurans JCM 10272]
MSAGRHSNRAVAAPPEEVSRGAFRSGCPVMQSLVAAAISPPMRSVPFTRWRRIAFAISLFLLAATVALVAVRGFSLGLDFTGGLALEARSAVPFDTASLRAALAASGHADAVIQLTDAGRSVLVRIQDADGASAEAVRAALGPAARIVSEDSVGPKVSGELLRSGLLSCLLAVSAIAIYVWWRFEVRFGLSACLTTFHDVAMMLGFFALTGLTFDLTSVAALLLVAGYSINDTVIVFDRIREERGHYGAMPLPEVIDLAITDTLRRTLMTSGTTLATTISLMLFGGPVLFGFAAATTFGIALGTLSSIFIAAPLLLVLPGPVDTAAKAAPDEAFRP